MAVHDCPLPDVADALAPYIRPRDEVAAIRHELQSHVAKQLGRSDTPLSSVTLTDHRDSPPSEISASLTGVRKAYLQALQAHATAQARYDALKADLSRLSSPSDQSLHATAATTSLVNDIHIPLLRQRERLRRLHVVEHTFARIGAVGRDATVAHLDDIVRQRAGELPSPPTNRPPAFDAKPDVEARVLQLKKAVLATKRRVDHVTVPTHPVRTKETASPGVQAEITGLRSALTELTGWMEQQLATIGDAEAEPDAVPPTPRANGASAPETASLDDIADVYETYLSARHHLIQTLAAPPAPSPHLPTTAVTAGGLTPKSTVTPAETLLPHILALTTTNACQLALLAQPTYLRRQISLSEAETQRLLARLADESFLVHPGAGRGRDWAEAGAEAGKVLERFVEGRVRAGLGSAGVAKKVLGEVRSVPGMVEGLGGGV
ncbi:hypothetical protein LTR08_006538 [Meristemomyces frigidus]|nr:hypothetical protein LTR08_006538 [Meristemomyces frigidus]